MDRICLTLTPILLAGLVLTACASTSPGHGGTTKGTSKPVAIQPSSGENSSPPTTTNLPQLGQGADAFGARLIDSLTRLGFLVCPVQDTTTNTPPPAKCPQWESTPNSLHVNGAAGPSDLQIRIVSNNNDEPIVLGDTSPNTPPNPIYSIQCSWASEKSQYDKSRRLCIEIANAAAPAFQTWLDSKDAAAMHRWQTGSDQGDDKSTLCKSKFGNLFATYELDSGGNSWGKKLILATTEDGRSTVHC